VLDDTQVDRLTGGKGGDWFLLNRFAGTAVDQSDATPSETQTDL
jgi:hypothetical protein